MGKDLFLAFSEPATYVAYSLLLNASCLGGTSSLGTMRAWAAVGCSQHEDIHHMIKPVLTASCALTILLRTGFVLVIYSTIHSPKTDLKLSSKDTQHLWTTRHPLEIGSLSRSERMLVTPHAAHASGHQLLGSVI